MCSTAFPYTTVADGKRLYDFIRERPGECLELGFAHGVSSCYIAAGLEAAGAGHLTTVDMPGYHRDPSIEQLLSKLGLEHRVTVERPPSGYNWFLKGEIEGMKSYDFIDGSHNWAIDSAAFFLVDRVLRPEGWLLFDDYNWTYDGWAATSGTDDCAGIFVSSLTAEERLQAHVERIFQLLVVPHPAYSEFRIENERWAWAQKVAGATKTITIREDLRMSDRAARLVKRGRKLFR